MSGPKALFTALLIGALTAGSTLTFAAPPLPAGAETQSSVIKVNEHRKRSQNNYNRPSAPQAQPQRRKKNNNEAVAIGVGIAAVIGALALSQQAQSQPAYGDGMRQECRRLRWKCREGRGWACRKYDDVCR